MREMYYSTFVYLKNFVLPYFGIRDSGFGIPDFTVAPQKRTIDRISDLTFRLSAAFNFTILFIINSSILTARSDGFRRFARVVMLMFVAYVRKVLMSKLEAHGRVEEDQREFDECRPGFAYG